MTLDKIFGLYTLGFLLVTILIGIAELAFAAEQMDWLDLHGAVAGYLRLHWHHHTHVQC